MKIVYVDTLELTHSAIKEIFKKDEVLVFKKLGDFIDSFDVSTVQERRVIIIDIPINIDKNIGLVKELILLRSLSEGNMKIILYSDYNEIRFGFNKILMSPDLTVDKKIQIKSLQAEVKKTYDFMNVKLCDDKFSFPEYPTLTYSEYKCIIDLMRWETVKKISRVKRQGIKVIYTHRRNIFVKYNFKNITELHSSITYE